MSWLEQAVVISAHPNLLVRSKFGRVFQFKNDANYKDGDYIPLLFSKNGDVEVLESEHTHTSTPTEEPIKEPEIDYETLYYVE